MMMATRLLLIAALLIAAMPATAQIVGPARVVDGDTIEIQGQRIRLWGIDAPEFNQSCYTPIKVSPDVPHQDQGVFWHCGQKARFGLYDLIKGDSRVRCEQRDRDRYGRIVATCSTEAGDIGAEMVRQGWAIDFEKYSRGRYAAEQAEAKAAKRGMWSGRFDLPEDWRQQRGGAN